MSSVTAQYYNLPVVKEKCSCRTKLFLAVVKKFPATVVNIFLFNGFFITARKRSLGQGNVFTPVCHSVCRGGSAQPPWRQTFLGRPAPLDADPQGWADPLGFGRHSHPSCTPPRCWADPQCRPLWGWVDPPQMQTPLGLGRHPPRRSTSRRYASYWNAYLSN